MTVHDKLEQGTAEWFEMVGTVMSKAAEAELASDVTLSLLERYTDGDELPGGLVQGIRFDIVGGRPSYRVGAWRGETADIMIEVTRSAARELNLLHSADPKYRSARDNFLSTAKMRVTGDVAQISGWLDAVHDLIFDRTK